MRWPYVVSIIALALLLAITDYFGSHHRRPDRRLLTVEVRWRRQFLCVRRPACRAHPARGVEAGVTLRRLDGN